MSCPARAFKRLVRLFQSAAETGQSRLDRDDPAAWRERACRRAVTWPQAQCISPTVAGRGHLRTRFDAFFARLHAGPKWSQAAGRGDRGVPEGLPPPTAPASKRRLSININVSGSRGFLRPRSVDASIDSSELRDSALGSPPVNPLDLSASKASQDCRSPPDKLRASVVNCLRARRALSKRPC